MRYAMLFLFCINLLTSTPTSANTFLDDYLNNIRIDQRAPQWDKNPKDCDSRELDSQSALGQTFTTGPDVDEIYAVCVQLLSWAPNWGKDTDLVLSLYDTPDKSQRLAIFKMKYDWRCWDNGKIVFPVKISAQAGKSYYFELTAEGGDGRIGPVLTAPSDYPGGQAYLNGKPQNFDLIFEDYTRPKLDRDTIYRSQFAKINLNYPGLEKVKAAAATMDWDNAARELVSYFEHRTDLFDDPSWNQIKKPGPDPKLDLTDAKLALNMQVRDPDGQIISLGPDWTHLRWWPKRGGVGLTREGIRKHLANGYLNTGDENYASVWNDMLKAFFIDYPSQLKSGILPGDAKEAPSLFDGGIGGARMWDGLALGARLRHQLWYYMIFAKSPKFTWDVRAAFIMNLVDMAEVLAIQEGHGNWKDQMCYGLFEFGRQFPEFTRSKDFMQKGFDGLVDNMRETMLPDGPMGEAPNYQTLVHNQYLMTISAVKKAGIKMPDDLYKQVEKAYEYHMYTVQPDGGRPAFGDSIGADLRKFLLPGAKEFGRKDMLWVATGGAEGVEPVGTSRAYPYSGYFVMRSDWSPDARYLCLKTGDYGHGHLDSLGFILHAYGNPLVIDPGVYVYGTPDTDRLISTKSHSTIQVDGRDARETTGWNSFFSGRCVDYLNAKGPGYTGLDKNISAVRRIVFLKPDYWVFSDLVTGDGDHKIESRFHYIDTNASLNAKSKTAVTTMRKGGNLAIIPVDPKSIAVEMEKADHSLIYQTLTPALILKQSADVKLPFKMDNVLYPYRDKPNVRVSPLKTDVNDPAVSAVKVQTSDGIDYVVFAGGPDTSIDAGKISMKAECGVVRTNSSGGITGFSCISGSRLACGKVLAASENPFIALDVTYKDDTVYIMAEGREPSLKVASMGAKQVVINSSVPKTIKSIGGYFKPFEDRPE